MFQTPLPQQYLWRQRAVSRLLRLGSAQCAEARARLTLAGPPHDPLRAVRERREGGEAHQRLGAHEPSVSAVAHVDQRPMKQAVPCGALAPRVEGREEPGRHRVGIATRATHSVELGHGVRSPRPREPLAAVATLIDPREELWCVRAHPLDLLQLVQREVDAVVGDQQPDRRLDRLQLAREPLHLGQRHLVVVDALHPPADRAALRGAAQVGLTAPRHAAVGVDERLHAESRHVLDTLNDILPRRVRRAGPHAALRPTVADERLGETGLRVRLELRRRIWSRVSHGTPPRGDGQPRVGRARAKAQLVAVERRAADGPVIGRVLAHEIGACAEAEEVRDCEHPQERRCRGPLACGELRVVAKSCYILLLRRAGAHLAFLVQRAGTSFFLVHGI